MSLSPGMTRYRPGSRAILANSSASSLKDGRLSASSIQHLIMIMYTSMVHVGGCGNRSPFSSRSGTSRAGTFSYGRPPYVNSSHTVTPTLSIHFFKICHFFNSISLIDLNFKIINSILIQIQICMN